LVLRRRIITLKAGRSAGISLSLDGAGRRALAAHHTLEVKLASTQSGKAIERAVIPFHAGRRARERR
jgi:hypothetical protein